MNCNWASKINNDYKCERHADQCGYCIFHKKNKNNRENIIFNAYIKKGKITDFTGFCFEDDFDIKKIINYSYDELKFNEVIFNGKVNFDDYIFEGNVNFYNTQFNNSVKFDKSTFLKNCIFYNIRFNEKYINNRIFQYVGFNGQKLTIEKCVNFPRLDGITFSPYTKFILKDTNYTKDNALCGKNNFKIARIQAKRIEDIDNIGYYYYNERNYASNYINEDKYVSYKDFLSTKFFDLISKYVMGYGEKPLKLLLISISVVSIFALIYMFVGIKSMDYGLIKINFTNLYTFSNFIKFYIEAWYFSIITFCTVGYGDILVMGLIGKVFVGLEVFLGVTINAIWTSMLLNRMIR